MNQVAFEPNGHVLVLVDGLDAFEGADEVTRVDITSPIAQENRAVDLEEAHMDGMLALAIGIAVIAGCWDLFGA